jgi:hypothetical protein
MKCRLVENIVVRYRPRRRLKVGVRFRVVTQQARKISHGQTRRRNNEAQVGANAADGARAAAAVALAMRRSNDDGQHGSTMPQTCDALGYLGRLASGTHIRSDSITMESGAMSGLRKCGQDGDWRQSQPESVGAW